MFIWVYLLYCKRIFFICVCVSLCLKIAEPIRGKYCKERERAKQRSTIKAGEKMEVSQDRSKGQPDLWKGWSNKDMGKEEIVYGENL